MEYRNQIVLIYCEENTLLKKKFTPTAAGKKSFYAIPVICNSFYL